LSLKYKWGFPLKLYYNRIHHCISSFSLVEMVGLLIVCRGYFLYAWTGLLELGLFVFYGMFWPVHFVECCWRSLFFLLPLLGWFRTFAAVYAVSIWSSFGYCLSWILVAIVLDVYKLHTERFRSGYIQVMYFGWDFWFGASVDVTCSVVDRSAYRHRTRTTRVLVTQFKRTKSNPYKQSANQPSQPTKKKTYND
jgi:hypothetical protein